MRGIGLRGVCNYLKRYERPGLADEIVADLPIEQRPTAMGFLAPSTYEVAVLDALLRGYQRELERSGRAAELDAKMRALGAYIAEDNLNSVFKLVLSLVRPHTFVEKLPTLWALYFTDIDARVRMTGERSGTCSVYGLPVSYLAPVASGWIEYGMRHVGAKEPLSCREESWTAGRAATAEARYVISWT